MKKLNYLWMLGLLMFAAVNFSACSSDDEEDAGSASELVGLWERISTKGWEKVNGKIDYQWDEEEEGELRVRLKSDGTYAEYEFYGGEWEMDDTGTWEYKNGKIYTTSYDEYDEEYATAFAIVKELSSSRFALETTWTEVYEGDTWEGYSYQVYRKVSE